MSQLGEYIAKIREYKEQNPQITDEKLIRYVYLDLGKRFSLRDIKKILYLNESNFS